MKPVRWPGMLAALPDAITAGFFFLVWWAPQALGPHAVRTAVLIMLVEFVLVHAAGFIGRIAIERKLGLVDKLRLMLPLLLGYGLFVGAWALMWREWWPFLAFAWLVVGKLQTGTDPSLSQQEQEQQVKGFWGLSVVIYLLVAFVTVIVPMPRFGITDTDYGLPGAGLWMESPHIVVAFGAIYFSLLSLARYAVSKPVDDQSPMDHC
ncbi:MAG: hypothetical protein JJU31_04150 [Wenzhouxiangella sp.]|nr:hypothetical protein [Wenzhouxiangella sp.]